MTESAPRSPESKPRGPYDRCPDCQGWKAKKAYRCRACTPLIREAARLRRKSDASPSANRQMAQRLYELGACDECGGVATERHHRDGDTSNNTEANIAILCRRCHMTVDGRLARLIARNQAGAMPARPCRICARLTRSLRHGRCDRCRAYFDRTGRERP